MRGFEMGVPRLPFEKADFAQVVVNKGNIAGLTRSPTRGSSHVAPLKAISGTQDNRLSPFVPKPDSNVSEACTMSSHCGYVVNWFFQVPLVN